MCGGVPYIIKARSTEHMEETIAQHGRKKSICSFDPLSGEGVFRLAILGEHDEEPLEDGVHKRVELLDREAMGDDKARAIDFGVRAKKRGKLSSQTPLVEREAVGALTPSLEE